MSFNNNYNATNVDLSLNESTNLNLNSNENSTNNTTMNSNEPEINVSSINSVKLFTNIFRRPINMTQKNKILLHLINQINDISNENNYFSLKNLELQTFLIESFYDFFNSIEKLDVLINTANTEGKTFGEYAYSILTLIEKLSSIKLDMNTNKIVGKLHTFSKNIMSLNNLDNLQSLRVKCEMIYSIWRKESERAKENMEMTNNTSTNYTNNNLNKKRDNHYDGYKDNHYKNYRDNRDIRERDFRNNHNDRRDYRNYNDNNFQYKKDLNGPNKTKQLKSILKKNNTKNMKRIQFDGKIENCKIFKASDEPNCPEISDEEYIKIQEQVLQNPHYKIEDMRMREINMEKENMNNLKNKNKLSHDALLVMAPKLFPNQKDLKQVIKGDNYISTEVISTESVYIKNLNMTNLMVSYYSTSQIPKCPIIREEKMFEFTDDSILKIENEEYKSEKLDLENQEKNEIKEKEKMFE